MEDDRSGNQQMITISADLSFMEILEENLRSIFETVTSALPVNVLWQIRIFLNHSRYVDINGL